MGKSTVFISYSHKDEQWKDRLMTQLGALPGDATLTFWDDRQIGVGENWHREITEALDEATLAVLLISAHFLTSKFITEEEVPRLRQRRLPLYPIIVQPCPWQRQEWLAGMLVRPKDGKPLSSGDDYHVEDHLATFAGEIADMIAVPAVPAAAAAPEAAPVPIPPPLPAPEVTTAPAAAPDQPASSPGAANAEVITETSRVAGDAVRSVAALIHDDAVRAIVERFNSEFAAVSRVIEALTDYKALHDELHQVEFHCYRSLLTESRRREGEEVSWDTLLEHEMTLLASINQLQALADRAQLPAPETSWIPTLVEAHRALTTALEQQDRKSLRTAAALLSRVLTVEPIKLNDRMTETTHAMDLSPLERALAFVRTRLADNRLHPERLEQVRAGVAALDSLGDAVKALVREHDRWQELEFNLRRIESSLAGGIAEVEYSWPAVRELAEPLYASSQEQWARSLAAYGAQVQSALDSVVPNRAEQVVLCFRRFRRQASEQFFRVDTNLRDSCGKLGGVGEPLLLLLRMVEGS